MVAGSARDILVPETAEADVLSLAAFDRVVAIASKTRSSPSMVSLPRPPDS